MRCDRTPVQHLELWLPCIFVFLLGVALLATWGFVKASGRYEPIESGAATLGARAAAGEAQLARCA